MVDRFWLEPNIFRISKVGQSVLTATDNNLIFNGSYSGAAKFIKGSISASRGGNGVTTNEVFYGKTFTIKPMVFVFAINTSGGSSGGSFPGEGFQSKTLSDCNSPHGFFSLTWTRLKVEVLLDRVRFEMSSASSSFNYTIHYAVLDHRFGV